MASPVGLWAPETGNGSGPSISSPHTAASRLRSEKAGALSVISTPLHRKGEAKAGFWEAQRGRSPAVAGRRARHAEGLTSGFSWLQGPLILVPPHITFQLSAGAHTLCLSVSPAFRPGPYHRGCSPLARPGTPKEAPKSDCPKSRRGAGVKRSSFGVKASVSGGRWQRRLVPPASPALLPRGSRPYLLRRDESDPPNGGGRGEGGGGGGSRGAGDSPAEAACSRPFPGIRDSAPGPRVGAHFSQAALPAPPADGKEGSQGEEKGRPRGDLGSRPGS
ncbi:uncharacterized protein LOC106734831 [Tupaia chinensis]|uniref:uncharacterized protein LOC106734831 n=1 Tax=Tupaia chinensis TaxID=246437 RepID=UPI000FFB7BC6|nr:uncharacterized protein LOC106734831 [Tupaia chinensis]